MANGNLFNKFGVISLQVTLFLEKWLQSDGLISPGIEFNEIAWSLNCLLGRLKFESPIQTLPEFLYMHLCTKKLGILPITEGWGGRGEGGSCQ